jgi:hypothetical protein
MMMDLTARDVSFWRRELIDWYDDQGVDWFHTMILMGKQRIRPTGPPRAVAEFLTRYERSRLADASLWFVDGDTCDLVNAAHDSMPPFAPIPQDLPSKVGFVLFRRPVMLRDAIGDTSVKDVVTRLSLLTADVDEARIIKQVRDTAAASGQSMSAVIESIAATAGEGDPVKTDLLRQAISRICNVRLHEVHDAVLKQQIKIMGVSWSPALVSEDPRFPVGGVWLSFYATSSLEEVISDEQTLARCRGLLPKLMIDNEAVVPWYPGEGNRTSYLLPMDTATTWGWARMVFATFRLGAQRGLCEQVQQRTERAERRRTQRAQLPARDVTVVRLRRRGWAEGTSATGSGAKHGHRYPVMGHWRDQWYPSVEDHRPIWINQHIRGPEGTELRDVDRVTIV